MIKLHKYAIGQVWKTTFDQMVCIAAISEDENSMVGFPYNADDVCFRQLVAMVSSEIVEYVGTVTNVAALKEIEFNYKDKYVKLLSEVHPKYIRQSVSNKTTCEENKLSAPRGSKPHHIGIYCPEINQHFYSMRECERYFNVNHGKVIYSINTKQKLLDQYTLVQE